MRAPLQSKKDMVNMHPLSLNEDASVSNKNETKFFYSFLLDVLWTVSKNLHMADLLQLEIITGCAFLSPEAGVLNTIVCTEPEDVPTHKVGKALESAMKILGNNNILLSFILYK